METVNQHAPCKQKHIPGNHFPFMNKNLSKEIVMHTSSDIGFSKPELKRIKESIQNNETTTSLLRKVKSG